MRNFVTSPREPPGKASRSSPQGCEVANPVIPTKPNEARRCRKTSFCFICLGARPLASQWHRKQNKGCEATFLRNEVLSAPAASRIGKASRSRPQGCEVANSVIPAPSSQSPPIQSYLPLQSIPTSSVIPAHSITLPKNTQKGVTTHPLQHLLSSFVGCDRRSACSFRSTAPYL